MFAPKTNTQTSSPKNNLFGASTNGFIQPKLNVGQPGDKYEVEADKAADQIVAKGKDNASSFIAPAPQIQKQSEEDVQKQEADQEIQQKPVVEPITPGVQLKTDPMLQQSVEEEVQTNEGEEEVQQQKEDDVQAKSEKELTQAKESDMQPQLSPVVQKQAEEDIQEKEDEEVQEKEEEESLQKQSTAGDDGGSNIEQQLSDSKGGGSALDSGTQSEMESGFGADFSGVRVHNDSNAVQMNQELGSQAFTNGNDIYFNEGKYNPESDSGKHLLAHELTHTVQQGASPSSNNVQQKPEIQKEEAKAPAEPRAPTSVIDLTNGLKLSKDWLDYIEANPKKKSFDVRVKLGTMYSGTISLKKLGKAKEGETQKFELASKAKSYLDIQGMEFLNPLKNAQIHPILVLNKFGDAQATSGFLSVRKGESAVTTNALAVIDSINANLEAMGFLGIDKINTGGLENKYENGGLNFKANELSVGVDGYIEASGSLGITNSAFTFDVTSTVSVAGLADGEFNLKRDEKGELGGKATINADIANVSASLTVEYEKGAVTIQGTGKMSSEKFSGEITLLVTDESKSKQMMHAALGVESMEGEKQAAANPAAPVKKTKGNQVLAGWGTLEATITPWLQGTANVGIDNKGQVTIVGTITVPNEIELMEQRGIKHDLFDVEIRAGYGIPLVGQVFLFASIGMFMNAGFGPLVLKDVAFTGTYSTDPNVLQNFSITGTLGINAFAILGLKAEAGVGVTLLGHDVKAGVSVTAAAGIKAYAEATPTFQYQEQKSPQGGKVGESRLKGHFEAAAQLFLQLSGSLFYELDSPWWSPAPDGREDYPLGEVQYPIGDSMGIGADVDWLVGSPEAPELKFSPVEFDPNKFTADVMADPPPRKMGKSDQEPKGKFQDKGGGDQQKDPKATGDGKGLPPNSKKQEDLKNLPDDQKYLRGLDELSKLEKADPKPTTAVVKAKMKKVKSKYGLEKVTIKSEKDGEVTVYVKHKKQDNTKNLLQIKTMSEAERKKLIDAAMTDLKKREEKIVDKEGKTEEAKAKDMLQAWAKAHPIMESAKVVDGKETWDYLVDKGDKTDIEKGKPKAGGLENVVIGEEVHFKIGEESHRIWFVFKNEKAVLMMASDPKPIGQQDELQKEGQERQALNKEVTQVEQQASSVSQEAQKEEATEASVQSGSDKVAKEQRELIPYIENAAEEDLTIEPGMPGVPEILKTLTGSGFKGAFDPPTNKLETKYKNGYVGNVPMGATNSKGPHGVAALYHTDAFNADEAPNQRFGLVIGLNLYADLENNNEEKVKTAVNKANGWQGFPLGAFGFLWKPQWRKKGKKVDFTEVQKSFNRSKKEVGQARLLKEQQTMMSNMFDGKDLPYGIFRDTVLKHPYTSQMRSQMQQRADNVYIHTGDPDSVSLKPHAIDGLNQSGAQNLVPGFKQVAEGLFNRYDSILASFGEEEKHVVMVSGGYQMTEKVKLDLNNVTMTELATFLASELDMALRQSMVKVDPRTVYFPEPNTLIKVTPTENNNAVLEATFGKSAGETTSFIRTLAIEKNTQTMKFVDAKVLTGVDKRFIVKAGDSQASVVFNITQGMLAPDIKLIKSLMVSQSQTHAKKRSWVNQIGAAYGISTNTDNGKTIKKLFAIAKDYFEPLETFMNLSKTKFGQRLIKANSNILPGKRGSIVGSDLDVKIALLSIFDDLRATVDSVDSSGTASDFLNHFKKLVEEENKDNSQITQAEKDRQAQTRTDDFFENVNELGKTSVLTIIDFFRTIV